MGMDATFLGTAGQCDWAHRSDLIASQARWLAKLGSACEVSIPVRLLTLAGYSIWLAYGLAIGDLPLILVDLAGVVGEQPSSCG